MSSIKDYLLQLEESNIITWDDDFNHYYVTGGDPRVPFNLSDYISQRNEELKKINEKEKTSNR